MFDYLKKRWCTHPVVRSVHRLTDESLGIGNERYLWVGICKECGADVDVWPVPSFMQHIVRWARSALLMVAFAAAIGWVYYMLK